jgi:hypothetical protein
MRRGVKTLSTAKTVSLSGNPATGQTLKLMGASGLQVGSPVIERPSAKLPNGVLGIVTAVHSGPGGTHMADLRPAALSEVFSSLQISASGTLSSTTAAFSSSAAHAAGLAPLKPHFACSGAAPTPHIDVDLSDMHYSFKLSLPNSVSVSIEGTPSFSVGFNFPDQVTCTGSITASIPLGDTGLFLEIGPQFSVDVGGVASAAFTWKPHLTFALYRSRSGAGDSDTHQFTSEGSIGFGGSASVGAQLALKVGVNAFGRAGIEGTIGPRLDENVSSSGGQNCRSLNGSAAADLEAYAHVFFADWTFDLAHITFWQHQFSHECSAIAQPSPPPPPPPAPPVEPRTPSTGSTLVYDGDTALPPEEDSFEFTGELTFNDWAAATGQPAEVNETLPSEITPYRCVVLLSPKTLDGPQESELADYVRRGGTLLAIGEHEGGSYDVADETLSRFAASLGLGLSLNDNEEDYGPHTTYDIDPSPLTEDVFSLGDNWVSTVDVSGSAQPLAGTADNEQTFIAAQSLGSGQFVMAGDSNIFTDDNQGVYYENDNGQFVRNLCP